MPPTVQAAPIATTAAAEADYVLIRRRRRRLEKIAVGIGIAALLAGAIVGWVTEQQQSNVASRWRQKDLAETAVAKTLQGNLTAAKNTVTSLNGQVATMTNQIDGLNGKVSSLQTQLTGTQSQLSTVATQKEKAEDQNAALTQLLSAAGTVSSDLQTCVSDTDSFSTELFNDIDSGTVLEDPDLQSNATNTDDVCSTAESANHQLQSAIAAETGT